MLGLWGARRVISYLSLLAALLSAGCDSGGREAATAAATLPGEMAPSDTPMVKPEPTHANDALLPYTEDARTGLGAVDEVLAAVLGGDAGRLQAMMRFEERACVPPPAQERDVLCPDDVRPGTVLQVFSTESCHHTWRDPESVELDLAMLLSGEPRLLAVGSSRRIDAQYAVLFAADLPGGGSVGRVALVDGQHVTSLILGCASHPSSVAAEHLVEPYLLQPHPGG